MNNAEIRNYKKKDYAEVIKLWTEVGLHRKERGDTPEIIDATIANGGRLILLIDKTNKKIIGTSWLSTDYRRVFLSHFCVKTEYQGKGLSHILLAESFKFAQKLNLQIKLEVRRTNHRALNLYQNKGFKHIGDHDVYIARDIYDNPYSKNKSK